MLSKYLQTLVSSISRNALTNSTPSILFIFLWFRNFSLYRNMQQTWEVVQCDPNFTSYWKVESIRLRMSSICKCCEKSNVISTSLVKRLQLSCIYGIPKPLHIVINIWKIDHILSIGYAPHSFL
jgi:hypothetical protein